MLCLVGRQLMKKDLGLANLYSAGSLMARLWADDRVPQDGLEKNPRVGKGYNYWIIDWKTSGSWGWRRDKKQDLGMTAQLILYKHFWAKKHNIDLKDIRFFLSE